MAGQWYGIVIIISNLLRAHCSVYMQSLGHWRVRIPIFQFEQISGVMFDVICFLYVVKRILAVNLEGCDCQGTKKKSLWLCKKISKTPLIRTNKGKGQSELMKSQNYGTTICKYSNS